MRPPSALEAGSADDDFVSLLHTATLSYYGCYYVCRKAHASSKLQYYASREGLSASCATFVSRCRLLHRQLVRLPNIVT